MSLSVLSLSNKSSFTFSCKPCNTVILTVVLTLLLSLISASPSFAGWTQVASPTSENLNGTWFADATTGVCVGDNGAVALTTDGTTFVDRSISGGTNLNGVHFASDVVGVPAYENFETYIEEDNNAPEPDIVTVNPTTTNRHEFAISGDSVIGDDVYVYQDFGAGYFSDAAGFEHLFEFIVGPGLVRDFNWSCPWVVDNAITPYENLAEGYSYCTFERPSGAIRLELYDNNAVVFVNVDINKAYRDTVLYGKATNDGANMTVSVYSDAARTVLVNTLTIAASNNSYRYLYALDTDTRAVWWNNIHVANIDIQDPNVFTAGNADTVYRSTSSGAVWNPEITGSGVQMNDVHFYDDQNGWAVGENGTIYITANAGETWVAQTTGSANLQSVFFTNSTTGWIAGTGGTIYIYDGVSSWNTPTSGVPAVDLFDIHFVDANTGWAVGANGTIIKTTDGGFNWVAQTSTTTSQLNGLYFVDTNIGYATGMSDSILKTTDGGLTWIPQAPPSSGFNFNDIYFVDGLTGYICGDNGTIMMTTDGGAGSSSNLVALHPIASTVDVFTNLNGCADGFDCVNDQLGNASTGYPLAVDNDGTKNISTNVAGDVALFDLEDSAVLGIPAASTITGIEIFAQGFRVNAGGGAEYLLSYDIGGGLQQGPVEPLVVGGYQLLNYQLTGLSWTTTDLDNLKIGVTHNGSSISYLGQVYVYVTYIPAYTISGRIFEDVDYAGGAGAAYDGGATDVGLDGVEVELYDSTGNWVVDADAFTAGGGHYSITGVPTGTYYVRARSATITGAGPGTLPEQTYEYNGVTGNGSNGALGGNDSQVDDTATGDNNVGGAGDTNVVIALSSDLTGIDLGFSYNLISNAKAVDQGSLDQFIDNANVIAGANSSQFMIASSVDPLGRTTDPNYVAGVATITPSVAFADITDSDTVIDASTQRINSGLDTNALGPEIEINGNLAGAVNGFTINNAANVRIQELTINRFGGHGVSITGGGATGATLYGNYIGIDAANTAVDYTYQNDLSGVNVDSSGSVIGGVYSGEGNLIAYNWERGIYLTANGDGANIIGNEIRDQGLSGIVALAGSSNGVISKNLIRNNSSRQPLDEISIGDGFKVYHNTIHGSPGGDGISVEGPNAIIRNNIITGNAGYGIRIAGGSITTESNNLVTDNATAPTNGLGQISTGALDVATSFSSDPQYLADYSLTECSSPAINAGIDLAGDQPDMNGGTAGLWNSIGPDMGAFEAGCLGAYSISGRVYEDSDFNGTAANWTGDAGDLGLQNVDVELYDNADVYQRSTTTDMNGDFTFGALVDGTYKVRVRSATIGDDSGGPDETAPMGGFNACVPGTCAEPLPEMTWGDSAAMYGGQNATVDDTATGDNAGPGDTWLSVTVSGGSVAGVNFGFAYNLIVNEEEDANNAATRSKQGSLRQFVKNANAIGSAGSTTANYSQFRMQVGASQNDGADNWWRIVLDPVPTWLGITDSGTTIDGSTQRINSAVDSNARGPEIELNGADSAAVSPIYINNVGNVTIQELAINGFGGGTAGIVATGASTTNINIYGNYIGIDAIGENDGGLGGFGVMTTAGASAQIGGSGVGQRNIISGHSSYQIYINSSAASTIQGNYIGTDRTGTLAMAGNNHGIRIGGTSDGSLIGGPAANEGNIISGVGLGIYYDTASNLEAYGNTFGSGPTGSENIGNSFYAIQVSLAAGQGLKFGGLNAGEGNLLAYQGSWGIYIMNAGTAGSPTIEGNTIHDSGQDGIYINNTNGISSLTVAKNLVRDNGTSGSFSGIRITNSATGVRIYNNTIDGNTDDGIQNAGTGTIIKNNILTGNANFGYDTTMPFTGGYNFVTDSFNSPGNGSGCCNGQGIDGTYITTTPVNFTDYASKDFSLDCGVPSVAIDAGCDLGGAGDDTACDAANDGPQPDLIPPVDATKFNSTAPDMGAFESSCAVTPVLYKKAFLTDGTPIASGTTLPKGTLVKYLIYINNIGGAVSDVSVQDQLDPTFAYQTTSIRMDNTVDKCAAAVCTALEEDTIFTAVNGTGALDDGIDLVDEVSYISGPPEIIDAGNQNQANKQLDIAADKVWALLINVKIQ